MRYIIYSIALWLFVNALARGKNRLLLAKVQYIAGFLEKRALVCTKNIDIVPNYPLY